MLASVRYPQTVSRLEQKNSVVKEYLDNNILGISSASDHEVREIVDAFVNWNDFPRIERNYTKSRKEC